MATEIKRKLFHLASLIYVIGLIYVPRPRYLLILTALVVTGGCVEIIRLRVPSLNRRFMTVFGGLARAREEASFSGIFWMLLGVLATVLLLKPVSLAAVALLYLIFGDAVASLVGIRMGGPFWPGSTKRVSGSIACFLMCFFVGWVLLRPEYGWTGIVVGAVVATVVEGWPVPLDDNLSIPLVSSWALWACYQPF